MTELRDAVRALRSTPLVTSLAVLSLAMGIGANTAIFSLLNAIELRPLPVRDPESVIALTASGNARSQWPQAVWAEVRDRHLLSDAFAWSWTRFDSARGGERRPVDGMAASGGMFGALGLTPQVGRLLTPADDQLDAGPDGRVAVISDRYWHRNFAARSDIVGRAIWLDGRLHTIVGVTRPSFDGLLVGLPLDVVVPLGEPSGSLDSPYVSIMGRLERGRTLAAVTAALQAAQPSIRDRTNPYDASPYREEYLRDPMEAKAVPGGVSFLERRYGRPFAILLGLVTLVLLVACGNIAMLLLSRAVGRRREIGVRTALGASRWTVARQFLIESLLLSAVGTALGLVVARWCTAFVVANLSTQAYSVFLNLRLDWRVLAFTAGAGITTAVLFGVAPTFYAARVSPIETIRRSKEGSHALGFSNGVIVAQVATSLVLLIATGLFIRTFWALAYAPIGLSPSHVAVLTLDVSEVRLTSPAVRLELYQRITESVVQDPDVESAAISVAMPGGNYASTPWIAMDNGEALPQGPEGVYANRIGTDWFRTLGTQLLTGRDFGRQDHAGAPGVVIVNETFARRFLKGVQPIGRTLFEGDGPDGPRRPLQIVGVVEDAMYREIKEVPPPTVYTPIAQEAGPLPVAISLSVRRRTDSMAGVPRLVERVTAIDPAVSVTIRSLSDQIGAQYAQERLVATIATGFGFLASLLAALGLYGVTSYAVARRRVELGVRMALGASPHGAIRLVLTGVTKLVCLGVGLGLVAGVWSARAIGSMLYRVEPTDTVTFGMACTLMVAVAVVAAWLPARQAARTNPALALREL